MARAFTKGIIRCFISGHCETLQQWLGQKRNSKVLKVMTGTQLLLKRPKSRAWWHMIADLRQTWSEWNTVQPKGERKLNRLARSTAVWFSLSPKLLATWVPLAVQIIEMFYFTLQTFTKYRISSSLSTACFLPLQPRANSQHSESPSIDFSTACQRISPSATASLAYLNHDEGNGDR